MQKKSCMQCWTEGRSSTAIVEDLVPTATATVAEVLGHSYGPTIWNIFQNGDFLSLNIKTHPFFISSLMDSH